MSNSKRGRGKSTLMDARTIDQEISFYLWPVVRVKAVGTLQVGGVVRALRQLAPCAWRPQVQVAGPPRQLLRPRGRRHGRRAGAARREIAEVGHASRFLEGFRPATYARQVQLLLLGLGVVGPLRGRRLVERSRPIGRLLRRVRLVRPNLNGHTHKPNQSQRRRMRTTSNIYI